MKIPKQSKSTTAKVRKICCQYPKEFGETPAGDLRCNFCYALIKCDKKFFVKSHRKSKLHQVKLVTTSSSQVKQSYMRLDRANFKEKVVSSFPAADIPLRKLNHPALKSLFVAMGKPFPSETAARASVAKLESQKEENIPKLLRDKKVVLIVDETEAEKQEYINVLVGGLDTPNETLRIACLPLQSSSNINSSIRLHTVKDDCDYLGTNEKVLHCP